MLEISRRLELGSVVCYQVWGPKIALENQFGTHTMAVAVKLSSHGQFRGYRAGLKSRPAGSLGPLLWLPLERQQANLPATSAYFAQSLSLDVTNFWLQSALQGYLVGRALVLCPLPSSKGLQEDECLSFSVLITGGAPAS